MWKVASDEFHILLGIDTQQAAVWDRAGSLADDGSGSLAPVPTLVSRETLPQGPKAYLFQGVMPAP